MKNRNLGRIIVSIRRLLDGSLYLPDDAIIIDLRRCESDFIYQRVQGIELVIYDPQLPLVKEGCPVPLYDPIITVQDGNYTINWNIEKSLK